MAVGGKKIYELNFAVVKMKHEIIKKKRRMVIRNGVGEVISWFVV